MNEALRKDMLQQCASIHRWNAPGAIGYLCNPNRDGNEVATGMYCSRVEEIDPERWTYFVWFKAFGSLKDIVLGIYFIESKAQLTQLKNNFLKHKPA